MVARQDYNPGDAPTCLQQVLPRPPHQVFPGQMAYPNSSEDPGSNPGLGNFLFSFFVFVLGLGDSLFVGASLLCSGTVGFSSIHFLPPSIVIHPGNAFTTGQDVYDVAPAFVKACFRKRQAKEEKVNSE